MRLWKRRGPKPGRRNPPKDGPEWKDCRIPVPKLALKRGAEPTLTPPRKPDEENPPRKLELEEEDPPRPMDAPPREPPCIWAGKGAARIAMDNAAMASQRRIRGIIALVGTLNCQIFAELLGLPRVRWRAFSA